MRLILIGPPGSGKGTQAKLLSKRLHLVHIGTGDILREAIREKTPLGKIAGPYILRGELVPDDLVNEVIAERFQREDRPDCFVTDGYPRTVAQAAAFDQILRQQFLDLSAVLFLLVDDEEIVRRMTGRWSCPVCKSTYHLVSNPPKVPGVCDVCGSKLIQRDDDKESTVRERLKQYHQNTEGLLEYYKSRGLLHEVRGIGTIDQIYDKIIQELKQAKPSC
ncbi:MAG TPA: adenylate kinase [Gemmataceae bacterium]|jgi:adenylate kinase|nr:adenylate kinase [Gemmataceae bacterium]